MEPKIESGGRQYGKTMRTIMQAWDMAKDNPGKKIAVVSTIGTMLLEFKVSEGFCGTEVTGIEIDGEKQNV